MAAISESIAAATELAKGLLAKGKDLAAENADRINDVVEKAAGFVDEKTGGKFADQINAGKGLVAKVLPGTEGDAPAAPTV